MMTVDCTTSDSERTQSAAHHKHRSSSSHRSDGYIPPYLRKLNRRYKQLYNLMEGIVPSETEKLAQNSVSSRRQPITGDKWMEANLFEEQREQNDQPAPSIDDAQLPSSPPAPSKGNGHSSGGGTNSDEINEIPEDDRYADRTSDGLYKVSPKSKSFMYHRVMSANGGSGAGGSSSSGGGGGGGGGTSGRKQRLPFVAITNKRLQPSIGTSSMNHKNHRADVQQNMFPMP